MRTPSPIRIAALSMMLAAVAAPAMAQFKWVAPDGSVTYSDQPPPAGVQVTATQSAPAPRSREGDVPASLRQAAEKYPAILYTTAECAPCQQARAHLTRRGIPYAEKTVKTSADTTAFRRSGFTENSFPSLSVGRERSVGYESGEWDRLLDSAGYPKTSVLPPSYKQPPAQAMAPPAAPRQREANDAGGTATGETADSAARARSPTPMPTAQGPGAGAPPGGSVSIRF